MLDPESLPPNTSYAQVLSLAGAVETILDVGCNTGYLGRLFIERGATVAGIDNDEVAIEKASAVGIDARLADLDLAPIESVFPDRKFDLIVFADVLEHLKRPDVVLRGAGVLLEPGGRVVASIPNVAHGNVRLDLLLGRFEYTALGLLDNTHLRFFTAETIEQLFAEAGYQIEAVGRVTCPVDSGRIEAAAEALALSGGAPDLVSLLSSESSETFQYVVRAAPADPAPAPTDASLWTMGDRPRPVSNTPAYIFVGDVPNVIADMRRVIDGLEQVVADKETSLAGMEASLRETQEYLATVIRDKDQVISGLEASLAETRAYFEQVVEHRDGLIAGLEAESTALKRRFEELAFPSVTVVVVNWNGEKILPACLQSLSTQDYPAERYRVVVVDNGSRDDSVACARRDFPDVRVLEAAKNLGFAAGNNLAIETTSSDYVALLNNDAVAEPDWLRRLVDVAEADAAIGAVCSKVLLMHDRLALAVEVDGTIPPSPDDPRRRSARVAATASIDGVAVPVEFTTGVFPAGPEDATARWIASSATLRIPILEPDSTTVELRLLPLPYPAEEQPRIRFRVGDEVVAERQIPADQPADVRLRLDPGWVTPLVQNAGSVVLPDGGGCDRGSVVVGGMAFYDTDHGQFDAVEDVPAFCGAAALLRRSALEQVGAFDSSFFMYYEDTDLSLRLRRAGRRIVYTPAARVRHHHSATAVEWSPRFCYFVERNRLLMLLKNEHPRKFLREYARYSARLVRPNETRENRTRFLQVQRSLVMQSPRVVAARFAQRKARRNRGRAAT